MMTEVTFGEMAGPAEFSGIDRETASSRYGDDAERVRFVLNGVTYEVTEDPDDGYRSSHDGPTVTTEAVKNIFAPVDVICIHETESDSFGDGADILRIVCLANGKDILRIGTDNIDDYYPSYVCDYSAEAMNPA